MPDDRIHVQMHTEFSLASLKVCLSSGRNTKSPIARTATPTGYYKKFPCAKTRAAGPMEQTDLRVTTTRNDTMAYVLPHAKTSQCAPVREGKQ